MTSTQTAISSIEAVRRSAKAMAKANKVHESKLKIILPIGRHVFCFFGDLWYAGTVAAYTLPDDGEVAIKPDDKYRTVLERLISPAGFITVSVNDIELTDRDVAVRIAKNAGVKI